MASKVNRPGTCSDAQVLKYNNSTGQYECQNEAGGGGLPSGTIVLIVSGSCPSGFVEETSLNGKTLFGTLAANADVGATGGNDNITPAGTVSQPAFTGNALGTHSHNVGTYANTAVSAGTPAGSVAWPVGVPTFAGTSSTAVVNHVHVQSVNSAATGGLSGYTADTSTNTSVASGYSTANPTGGSASYTPAGTIAWPAGVPTFAGTALGTHNHTFSGSSEAVSAGTPAGTVSQPTFTGSSFDNRSAFVRVIFCRKS